MHTETMNKTEVLSPQGAATADLPAKATSHAVTAPGHTNPGTVLMYAMERGASLEQIDKLLDLQMKWEANEARKAYVADMAAFKQNPPTIIKDKTVGYKTREGDLVGYSHATLGNVTNSIVEGLAQFGFSHSWIVKQDNSLVHVTCRITHRMGHSEEVSMSAFKDDSGKKNHIQQVASTITYLERYTLLAATGLATHDQPDDDGAAAEPRIDLAAKWGDRANGATTLQELQRAWDDGLAEISNEGTEDEYQRFKATVNARKAQIEAAAPVPQPGRSSRVSSIISQSRTGQNGQA